MRDFGRRRPATLAALGLIAGVGALGAGVALAQKPPAAGAPPAQPAPLPQRPPQAAPGKPPALGAQPTPRPPVAAAPTPSPAPGGKPPSAQGQAPAPSVTPPPAVARPAAPAPAPQAIPANEPAGITALRQFLGTAQLSYTAAEVVDAATGRARMTGVVIVETNGGRSTADEVVVEQASREGVRYALVRNLQAQTPTDRFSIAEVELRNLVVRMPAAGADPAVDSFDVERATLRDARMTGQVEVVVGAALLEGWGQGRPTRIELTGVEFGGPPSNAPFDRLRMGRMVLFGTDIPGAIAAAIARRPATVTAGEPFLEAADLAATMQGQPVAAIASIAARSRVDASGSGTGNFAIRGVQVLPVPGIADWMQRFGYSEIRTEMTAESSYDSRTGRIEVTSFRLAGQDIGALTVSFLMDGMTQEAAARSDFSNVRLFGMSLGWLDQSILQRVVRSMAQGTGSTEAALRDQWATLAGAMLGQRAPGLDSIREAITRYIRGQANEIEIRAQPPQPVPVMSFSGIGSPAQAQQVLGLTATAR